MNKTISVSKENYDRLTRRGGYNESMDEIIGHVLDIVEKNEKRKEVNR